MKTITLVFLSLWACLLSGQSTQPDKYKLLWEITGPKLAQPSYLYGTMHVTDSRVFNMPDSVILAIQNSAGFALEVDFDAAGYLVLEYMYSQHGPDIFDEDTWQSNARSWDGDAPKPDPSDIFKLFERESAESTEVTFLDAFLYRLARENGKVITGLESILDQMTMLTEPQSTGPARPDSLGKGPSKRMRLSDMISVYETGDLDALDKMVNSGNTSQFFRDEVIVKRNHGMALRADSLIQIRPTFIGVGAAHLPGKEGVINLLKNQGYHLRPVKATYTGLNKTVREQTYQPKWTTFKRESDGYQIDVPTKPFAMDILDGQLKMYLGMDFPGGIVYCFYAMSMPGEVDSEKMDNVSRAIIRGFGSHNVQGDKTRDIEYKTLKGKEYVVKKSGEYMRIRVLFGNGKMYMLLLGNSEQVLFSPAAEAWFASLELFEPLRMTQQTPFKVEDKVNGFSLEFPGEPDYTVDNKETFTSGGENTPFNVYEVKNLTFRQRMVMLAEDFEDWYSIGRLEGRMADCILYYSGAALKPTGEFLPVTTDGIRGLEGTYLGMTGLKYRIRCYLRMNRLYLCGITLPEDDADSAVVDRVFDSLHFLPVPQPKIAHILEEPGAFAAAFPRKPTPIQKYVVPHALLGSIDSLTTQLYHDPATSLNTFVTSAHIWKYYAGSDADLIHDIRSTTELDSATVVHDRAMDVAGWSGHELVLLSYDSAMHDHRRWLVAGELLLEARIQTTADAAGQATADRFFQQFRPLVEGPATKDQHLAPKLKLLLAERFADDSLPEMVVMMNLGKYKLRPEEFGIAFDSLRYYLDTLPFNLDDGLLQMVLDCDDASLQAPLRSLFEDLPVTSPKRMQIVGALLGQDKWPGAAEWALARLKDRPSPLAYAANNWSWGDYLEDDSNMVHLRNIDFLLDDPELGRSLAADMAQQADFYDRDYHEYAPQLASILSHAIDAFDPNDPDNWKREYQMGNIIQYLMDDHLGAWQSLAKRMLLLPDSYLPGIVYVSLRDNGIPVSAKETKHVFESRYSRGEALTWALDNEAFAKLPAKYRSPEYVAAVQLDYALEEYPSRVELVEKRKIYFHGESQWLYIFRFAMEGDSDWTLGFAGPFPLTGDPEGSYFPLSGSNWEEYHPNSYVKKTKEWVKEMESYDED